VEWEQGRLEISRKEADGSLTHVGLSCRADVRYVLHGGAFTSPTVASLTRPVGETETEGDEIQRICLNGCRKRINGG